MAIEPMLLWNAEEIFDLCALAEGCEPENLQKSFRDVHENSKPRPSLWFAKDSGVYLMPNLRFADHIIYANGCGPQEESFEFIQSICGGDDFLESLPCSDIRALWAKFVGDFREIGYPLQDPSEYSFYIEMENEKFTIGFCGSRSVTV